MTPLRQQAAVRLVRWSTANAGHDDSATLVDGEANGLDFAGDTATIVLVSTTWDDEAGNQLDLDESADVTLDVE